MPSLNSLVRTVLRPPALVATELGSAVGTLAQRMRQWLLCNGVATPYAIAASYSGGTVVLTWMGDSTDVGAYVIERSQNNGPYQIRVWAGAGAQPGVHAFGWADTNVDPAGHYCYRLTAQHTNGTRGCPAAPVCVAGCNDLPTPFDLVAIAWGAAENRLRWQCDATDVAQFRIRRSRGGSPFLDHATVPAGPTPGVQRYSYSDLGVEDGIPYCYRIAAERADGTQGCLTWQVCAGTVYY
jgi:hypothetical protein